MNSFHQEPEFYGAGTLGEKGQVVIPAEARTAMKLKKGDKLLVFGMGNGAIVFTKADSLAKLASSMAGRLAKLQTILSKSQSK